MSRQRTRFDELRQTASRRPGILPGRRFALALALALAFVGGGGGAAWADSSGPSATVTIFPKAGGIQTESVDLSTCPTYAGSQIQPLYLPDGTTAPEQTYTTAWSVASVIGCLTQPAVPLTDVNKVLIEQPGGAPELSQDSQLLPADLTNPPNPSDFQNPQEAPLIYSDGSGVGYLRPWRGSGDANAQDQVYDPNPAPFQFEVLERAVLGATVTPSPGSVVSVGATVSFTVQAPGMGQGLAYSWDFDGAAPSSTLASPSVTFTAAGSYNVTVQVTDSAGDVSDSNPVVIQVGSAPPTSNNPVPPPTGPNHSHGKTPNGAPGNKPKPGTTTGHGHAKKSQKAHKGKQAQTQPSLGITPSSGSGSNGSTSTGTPTASHSAGRGQAHHAAKPKHRSTSAAGPATLVTGRLISDVIPIAAARSPLVHSLHAGLATAPAARRPVGPSILPALAAALTVFLLFTLGAGSELQWLRRRRLLRSSS